MIRCAMDMFRSKKSNIYWILFFRYFRILVFGLLEKSVDIIDNTNQWANLKWNHQQYQSNQQIPTWSVVSINTGKLDAANAEWGERF